MRPASNGRHQGLRVVDRAGYYEHLRTSIGSLFGGSPRCALGTATSTARSSTPRVEPGRSRALGTACLSALLVGSGLLDLSSRELKVRSDVLNDLEVFRTCIPCQADLVELGLELYIEEAEG